MKSQRLAERRYVRVDSVGNPIPPSMGFPFTFAGYNINPFYWSGMESYWPSVQVLGTPVLMRDCVNQAHCRP